MTVAEATTTADLERLRPEWEQLWTVAGASPFSHPAWLIPWWQHVAEGELWTLVVRDGGELVGLVPLYVYTQANGSRDVFLLGMGTSDYLDAIVRPGADVLPTVFDHLRRHRDRWDVLDLQPLPERSVLRTATDAVADVCPTLPLPAVLPGNVAQNLRYYRRRAERAWAVIEPATAGNLGELWDALRTLHAARWATRGRPGVLAADAVVAMHTAALPQLLTAGLLRMAGLRVDGQPVAVYYGLADRQRSYYYLGGFDPAWQHLSPGTLLIGHAVERATADGAAAFDFCKGREPYKYLWGAADVPTYARRVGPRWDGLGSEVT